MHHYLKRTIGIAMIGLLSCSGLQNITIQKSQSRLDNISAQSTTAANKICYQINTDNITDKDSIEFKDLVSNNFVPWIKESNVDLISLEKAWSENPLIATIDCSKVKTKALLFALQEYVTTIKSLLDDTNGLNRGNLLNQYNQSNINGFSESQNIVKERINTLEIDVSNAYERERFLDQVIWITSAISATIGVATTTASATAGQIFAVIGLSAQIFDTGLSWKVEILTL